MHPITVRTMKFDMPEQHDFHPVCIAGSAVLSYSHLAMSLYVAYLEPFFVKSLHRVKGQIQDELLYEEVDRFCRQETQHYQQHIDFNKILIAHGYPGLEIRIEKLKQDFDDFLATRGDAFCIGYIEGFESYTTQFALWVLTSGLYDHRKTIRPIGELFKWHMLEEVEHRNVAFDVYAYLYGNYLHRVRMCWIAQHHMFRFMGDCMQLMSLTDIERYGEQCRISVRNKVRMGIGRYSNHVRTMLPGYSPHKYVVPENIAQLSAHYTQMAQSIR